MSRLRNRLRTVEERVTPRTEVERPTINELWCYQLYFKAKTAVELYARVRQDAGRFKEEDYAGGSLDTYRLYCHRDVLLTPADVLAASDDILLEALGHGRADEWGWLNFMLHELEWFHLLASNWGLPAMTSAYGRRSSDAEDPTDGERRAQAVVYFLGMMRERGRDPVAEVRKMVELITARYKRRYGHEPRVERLADWMSRRHPNAALICACGGFTVRPEAQPTPPSHGRCLYRPEYATEMSAIARRLHRRWSRS